MNKGKYINKYVYVYADIFFAKGYSRTMMCDLKQNKWQFLPNEYYELILWFKRDPIDIIENNIKKKEIELYEFIEFLLSHNYAQIVDDISLFPDIELKWKSPHFIENSIIDIDESSNHDYLKIAQELQELFCKNIQLRCFCEKNISEIEDIIKAFMGRDFESVDFILKFSDLINENDYLLLARQYPSVSFVVHSAPKNIFFESKLKGIYPIVGYVQYVNQVITSAQCCGVINKESFVYPKNPRDFIEGIVRNRCLNAKISISVSGEIKNCPSMKISYGNIKTTSLMDVYKKKEFKKYWFLVKDKISVCKDCEYRYVCNDCRAFVKKKLGKPVKCNYDPYQAVWRNE